MNGSCDWLWHHHYTIITSLQLKNISKDGETITVQLGCPCGDKTLTGVDCLLYAIGRDPNTSDLGLEIPVCLDNFNNTSISLLLSRE